MQPNTQDIYIYMDDSWDSISTYKINHITNTHYYLNLSSEPFSEVHVIKLRADEAYKLKIYPFSFFTYNKYRKLGDWMQRIGDLASAHLSRHISLSLEDISKLILEHKDKYRCNESDIPWVLRCLVASGMIIPNLKKNSVSLNLSPSYKARENQRKFSATIAGELESLSQRVRYIIDHGPTVGTYRENLLQNSLRKHLPERYHIATGFIHGFKKQIDLLIYDRIDYAPLFREGDLVIVPQESVRAVIEVKTNLTTGNLHSALELLHLASLFDDNQPPFFKGIFAFESDLTKDKLYSTISDFYTNYNAHAQGAPGELICSPFQHLTCMCVNKKAFTYTKYIRNKNKRLTPRLYSKQSATELESQSSFFIQCLLSYLKYGGMKPFKIDYMDQMLGEDTYTTEVKDLRHEDDSWGAYFAVDEGDEDEISIDKMENLILSAQNWIEGYDNFGTA
ncbi:MULTISPECIES: DUF6602 domain-containing protein [Halomonadaceae]|uniref:DUF6602 domain-containing protein n=1 Tax=Halomonadaceae TaxID=28256 RepID=UPI0012F2791C|nr:MULTISPECIES: DUF6602 domain-containing protein [Halomonas]CAD5262740.1 conserved hypothetical protein [Halomonas sp. 113]CAD5264621.1 conserved hypothetical protein [Halomonas sp. 59]CAD5277486.1 conserved hypothetical protein [Halomonas sp. I3]CAD5285536.1 conserved hypothetical protein [Halomonas sp. 156]VXB50913.1 conserved hypothetical protein [Halomonas titanicae]